MYIIYIYNIFNILIFNIYYILNIYLYIKKWNFDADCVDSGRVITPKHQKMFPILIGEKGGLVQLNRENIVHQREEKKIIQTQFIPRKQEMIYCIENM